MPKKTSARLNGVSVRKKLAELNAQLQQAQAVADADRRIAETAKAEAKEARKAHKQARKAAKASKKQVKALRRQIKEAIAGGEGTTEAKPKTSSKRSQKIVGERGGSAAASADQTPSDLPEQRVATPADESAASHDHA